MRASCRSGRLAAVYLLARRQSCAQTTYNLCLSVCVFIRLCVSARITSTRCASMHGVVRHDYAKSCKYTRKQELLLL